MYTNISYGKECSYNTFHEIARSSDSLVMRNAAKILLLNIMFKDVYIYVHVMMYTCKYTVSRKLKMHHDV